MLDPFVIAFEGTDCTGKSHLTKMVKSILEKKGYKVEIVPILNGPLRSVILDKSDYYSEEERTIMLRLDAVATTRKIDTLVSNGTCVIMDRGPLTIYAYQGYAMQMSDVVCDMDEGLIESLSSDNVIQPDYTVVVTSNSYVLEKRLKDKEKDHYEEKGLGFIIKAAAGFQNAIENNITPMAAIDNSNCLTMVEMEEAVDIYLENIEHFRLLARLG